MEWPSLMSKGWDDQLLFICLVAITWGLALHVYVYLASDGLTWGVWASALKEPRNLIRLVCWGPKSPWSPLSNFGSSFWSYFWMIEWFNSNILMRKKRGPVMIEIFVISFHLPSDPSWDIILSRKHDLLCIYFKRYKDPENQPRYFFF